MAGNIFGTLFRITTWGESHGPGIGVVIDGCPAGLKIDIDFIQQELDRRRPGQSKLTTSRKEKDQVEVQSGVLNGMTTGTPISLFIPNEDQKSKDYSHLKETYRPSHADYTYDAKYGFRDYAGGGRSSARETAARVAAGAIAKLLLMEAGIHITAFVSQVGSIAIDPFEVHDFSHIEENNVRCPDPESARKMADLILEVKKKGDTVGGRVSGVITGVPAGLGEPVFDKIHADLGKAMLSINAVKGFEIGSGFSSIEMLGSEHNDTFMHEKGIIQTRTNHSGGIQGGISNGMPITFNVAFKPVATIMRDQASVSQQGEEVVVSGAGRHDPCVVPRAVPIVEAMAALVMADHMLRQRGARL